jgi:hypothetical protein
MRALWITLFLSFLSAGPARAADPSAASAASASASAQIVDGSVGLIVAGTELTLVSAQRVGQATVLVVRTAGGTVSVAVKLGAEAAAGLGEAVGSTVEAVAVAGGHLLMLGGHSVAFVLSPDGQRHHHRRQWP